MMGINKSFKIEIEEDEKERKGGYSEPPLSLPPRDFFLCRLRPSPLV